MAGKSGSLGSDSSGHASLITSLFPFAQNTAVSAFLATLPKRNQIPHSIGRRCLLSKNVEIPVVSANLVEDALWVVPLVQHRFNEVLSPFKPEPNWSFVSLSARIAFHIQLHQFYYHPVPRRRLR